jgi:hypothetical protein
MQLLGDPEAEQAVSSGELMHAGDDRG